MIPRVYQNLNLLHQNHDRTAAESICPKLSNSSFTFPPNHRLIEGKGRTCYVLALLQGMMIRFPNVSTIDPFIKSLSTDCLIDSLAPFQPSFCPHHLGHLAFDRT